MLSFHLCLGFTSERLLLLLLLFAVNFRQGTLIYIPETNHVSTLHNVAAVLQLQSVLHVKLFPVLNVLLFYISTFCSMCVKYSLWLILLVLDFMLSRYGAQVFSE